MATRILYVIGSLEMGGAEQHLASVVCALKNNDWDPEVFVLNAGGPLTSKLVDADIQVKTLSLPIWVSRCLSERLNGYAKLILQILYLIGLLWKRRPQIMHCFLPSAYVVGGLASMFAPKMTRIMSRRSLRNYQSNSSAFSRIEFFLHKRMDIICANSNAVLKSLIEEGVDNHQLRLIYNGVELEKFTIEIDRQKIRQSIGIGKNDLVLVKVANLIPYKRHRDLLYALKKVRKQLPDKWKLVFIGRDDGIGDDLKRIVSKLNLQENVIFLGARNDVANILRSSNIGVLCSQQEGFSNAVLEGMAAALPMIVTNVGGNSEAVLDGKTGIVVSPCSPNELAEAILELLRRKNCKKLGNNGRDRVKNEFSLEKCIAEYEKLYCSVL